MSEGWVPLGDAADLADHGQWITGWIGDVPVVVRNFRGRVAGFRNVCSHRFAQMLTAPTGRGPLRCPYHAWVYGVDGVPTSIPFNDTDFHLDADACKALALTPVAIALVDGKVHAHLDAATPVPAPC